MAGSSHRENVAEVVADVVAFVTITVLWNVIMLVIDGAFLLTRPSGITFDPWVFVVPGVGFVGHVLEQTIQG